MTATAFRIGWTNDVDIPTSAQAEDAAARALMRLIQAGLGQRKPLLMICRELLRGPLVEDLSRVPGGYAMKAPTDPTLIEIARVGARLVELSYDSPNAVAQALREARELVEGLPLLPSPSRGATVGLRGPQGTP